MGSVRGVTENQETAKGYGLWATVRIGSNSDRLRLLLLPVTCYLWPVAYK